jgi:hypothetical protein
MTRRRVRWVAAGLLAALVVYAAWPPSYRPLTPADAELIRNGMSPAEVERVLGRPPDGPRSYATVRQAGPGRWVRSESWTVGPEALIVVTFEVTSDDDRVCEAGLAAQPTPQTFWTWFRTRTGL